VTIAAGFLYKEGAILCADMQQSQGYVISKVPKLVEYDKEWCKAAAAGSGESGDLIDALTQKIFEGIDAEKCDTLASFKSLLSRIVLDFHRKEIAFFPASDDVKFVELLVCFRGKQDKKATLLKTAGSAVKIQHPIAVIGTGVLVQYLMSQLYSSSMSLPDAVLLGVHLLETAKKHLVGCGGPSQLAVISDSGDFESRNFIELGLLEQYLDEFGKITKKLLFLTPDGNRSEDEFTAALNEFGEKIKEERRLRVTVHQGFQKPEARSILDRFAIKRTV
jgi:20S proteasome alpha/beta subunit